MRSSELTLPAGWTPPRRLLWAGMDAFLLVLCSLMVLGGILGIGTDQWHISGAFGLLGLVLIGSVVIRRRSGRTAPVGTDKGALRIGFSRVAMVQRLLVTVVGGMSATLFAIAGWDLGAWLLIVLSTPFAVGCAVVLGVRYVRGITVGELRLSPHDVRLRMDALDVTVPWEDIIALTAGEMRSSYGIVTGRLLELVVSTPPRSRRPLPATGGIRLPIHRIDVDEVVLHHLLTYYLEHPRARDELAGPAAVARLRDRAFTR